MTDIIIKSFNRPHYLDRCLSSIQQNVTGKYIINVLDDGTPDVYLQKIQQKFPEIKLLKSSQYKSKVDAIQQNLETGATIDGFAIPTELWYNSVKSSSDYVLVIEDDVWFSSDVDIDVLVDDMKTYQIPLLRLGWLGNYTENQYCEIKALAANITSVIPKKLFTSNKFIMDLFFYNRFKFFTILYKLGLTDNYAKQKYWSINSILMGLYRKDYWLAIWKDAHGKVDEKQQLRNAASWYHHNKKAVFARTNQEVLKTTFKSSATGSYHKYADQFDVNRMNFILNEAWLNNDFDAMENYPRDFSDDYIMYFLDKANHPAAQSTEWKKWANQFKQQYRDIGAKVD